MNNPTNQPGKIVRMGTGRGGAIILDIRKPEAKATRAVFMAMIANMQVSLIMANYVAWALPMRKATFGMAAMLKMAGGDQGQMHFHDRRR